MAAHGYRVGANESWWADLPKEEKELEPIALAARRHIEPWLSAVFQAEHLNLLIGSGFASAVSFLAGVKATGMDFDPLGTKLDDRIKEEATRSAEAMGRGAPNIEDQFRVAFTGVWFQVPNPSGIFVAYEASAAEYSLKLPA